MLGRLWRLSRVYVDGYGYDSLAYEMRVQRTCITFHKWSIVVVHKGGEKKEKKKKKEKVINRH